MMAWFAAQSTKAFFIFSVKHFTMKYFLISDPSHEYFAINQ